MREARWDLVVAHPPCTYLANSGVRWLYGGGGTTRDPQRWAEMEDGAEFFAKMLAAPAASVAVENPIMHTYGKQAIARAYRALTGREVTDDYTVQTVQPWMFGDGETKATQFWLKGLPNLVPTDVVDGRHAAVHLASPGPNRWKERSRTYPGIARAIAKQWGAHVQAEVNAARLHAALRQGQVDRLALELGDL